MHYGAAPLAGKLLNLRFKTANRSFKAAMSELTSGAPAGALAAEPPAAASSTLLPIRPVAAVMLPALFRGMAAAAPALLRTKELDVDRDEPVRTGMFCRFACIANRAQQAQAP